MSKVFAELRSALRRLLRESGFFTLVVALLAPALAATLAVGSAAYGLLLRPLPYPDGERLVELRGFMETMGFSVGLSVPLADEIDDVPGVTTSGAWLETGIRGNDVPAVRANAGLFATLGVAPLLGRPIAPEDGDDVALVSESVWRAKYGAATDVLDRTIDWRGKPRRIVGVMPDQFRFPSPKTGLWLPLIWTTADRGPERIGMFAGLGVIARLDRGLDPAVFQTALRSRFDADPRVAPLREAMRLRFDARTLRDLRGEATRPIVKQLGAAVCIVLLITGANLANLWMLRTLRRRRELAIASALGASRFRVAASVVAEIAVATALGTLLGLLGAPLATRALVGLQLIDDQGVLFLGIDGASAAMAVGFWLAASLLLAVVPWVLTRKQGVIPLQRTGVGVERTRQAPARRGLVAVQIAAAVALLGASGLLLRSLRTLDGSDTGFERQNVLVANIGWQMDEFDPSTFGERLRQLYARLAGDSRLGAVSFGETPPFSNSAASTTIRTTGANGTQEQQARRNVVGHDYFDTLGITRIAGRIPERGSLGEIVVDEAFARQHFGGIERALGSEIGLPMGESLNGPPTFRNVVVVGIVRSVKHFGLDDDAPEPLYYDFEDEPSGKSSTHFVARSLLPAAELTDLLRDDAKKAGLSLEVRQLDAMVRDTMAPRRSIFLLLSGFALFGMSLAMVGVYAVLAYSARIRIPELGLRRALGANDRDVALRMLSEAIAMLLPGLALGALAAYAVSKAIAVQLYHVKAYDPATWSLVVSVVVLAALTSAAGPALRAVRIQPTEALRHD